MKILQSIPESIFETLGLCIGFFVCFITLVQLIKEYKSKEKSTLSVSFVLGWVFVYAFWTLYGLRFEAIALSVTNSLAICIQIALYIIIVRKNKNINIE